MRICLANTYVIKRPSVVNEWLHFALAQSEKTFSTCVGTTDVRFSPAIFMRICLANTYVLKRPSGVDERLHFALTPKWEDILDGAAHVISASVLEQQMSQVQSRQALVLVEKLDRRYLVHLPPLLKDLKFLGRGIWDSIGETFYR